MATETTATTATPATASASAPKAGSARRFGWTMTVPSLLAMALVVGFPLLFAAWVSVHDYDLTEGGIGAFTGLANYAKTVGDELFAVAVQNTIVYSVSVVVLEVIVALGLSLLLNQPGLRFRNLYLAILLIPLLVSPVAVGLLWRLLLWIISL